MGEAGGGGDGARGSGRGVGVGPAPGGGPRAGGLRRCGPGALQRRRAWLPPRVRRPAAALALLYDEGPEGPEGLHPELELHVGWQEWVHGSTQHLRGCSEEEEEAEGL